MAEEDTGGKEKIGVPLKCIGPDPLAICSVNPLDFRMENGEWIVDPGWWRNLKNNFGAGHNKPVKGM